MNNFMKLAIDIAKKAIVANEIPVGAVIVKDGEIISTANNESEKNNNAILHAELLAIQRACDYLNIKYLYGMDIYVTLEPCAMCSHAISLVRMRNIYFAVENPKSGGLYNGAKVLNHSLWKPDVYEGLCENEAKEIITNFFNEKRYRK
ncbi:nucleoside deaminase [Anaplasmataceae bacterium AB001_6]|nr:nucleoside deaminase [Anaplasmataceae bacterium AB001_6]